MTTGISSRRTAADGGERNASHPSAAVLNGREKYCSTPRRLQARPGIVTGKMLTVHLLYSIMRSCLRNGAPRCAVPVLARLLFRLFLSLCLARIRVGRCSSFGDGVNPCPAKPNCPLKVRQVTATPAWAASKARIFTEGGQERKIRHADGSWAGIESASSRMSPIARPCTFPRSQRQFENAPNIVLTLTIIKWGGETKPSSGDFQ